MNDIVTAFAPASIGNLGVGFDMLGLALEGVANCCFGGPDMTTLYVTSTDGHFFRAETDRVGWGIYP